MNGINPLVLSSTVFRTAMGPAQAKEKDPGTREAGSADPLLLFYSDNANSKPAYRSRFEAAYTSANIILEKDGIVQEFFSEGKFKEAYDFLKGFFSIKIKVASRTPDGNPVDGEVSIKSIADENLMTLKDLPVINPDNSIFTYWTKDPWLRINLATNFAQACSGYARQLQSRGDNQGALNVLNEARNMLLETEANNTKYQAVRPSGVEKLEAKDIDINTKQRIEAVKPYISALSEYGIEYTANLFTAIELKLLDIEGVINEMLLLNKANPSAEDCNNALDHFSAAETAAINGKPLAGYFDDNDPDKRSNPWLKANIMIGMARAQFNKSKIEKKPEEMSKALDKLNECMAYVLSYYGKAPDGKPAVLTAKEVNDPAKAAAAFEASVKDLKDQKLADISSLYVFVNAQIAGVTNCLRETAAKENKKEDAEKLKTAFTAVKLNSEAAAAKSPQAKQALETVKKSFEEPAAQSEDYAIIKSNSDRFRDSIKGATKP